MLALLKNRSFSSLTLTQFLGAFNDNAFKQLLLLVCVSPVAWMPQAGWTVDYGQSVVGTLFAVPFVLFATVAGTIADRTSKSRIIRACKWAEIAIMGWVLVACFLQSTYGLFVGIFLMGLQSALFSPSKYGSIPELIDARDLSGGNALIQVTTMFAIIGGTAVGGLLLSASGGRLWVPALVYVAIAVAGTVASFGVRSLPAADPGRAMSWNAFRELRHHWEATRGDRALILSIFASGFFWLLGATLVFAVNTYGDWRELAAYETSGILALISLGIAVGSVLAGMISRERIESGLVPVGLLGVSACLAAIGAHPESPVWTTGCLALAGVASGMFLIPLRALIQLRPPAHLKGAVLGVSEMVDFTGVLLAGGVYALLDGVLGLEPDTVFVVLGVSSFVFMVGSLLYSMEFVLRLVLLLLVHTVYRLRVRGLENVPRTGGALLVCNHLSYVDPLFVGAAIPRRVRFLMHRSFFGVPVIGAFARVMGAIPVAAEDSPKEKIRSLQRAAELAAEGRVVCIFAEGGISRSGALLPFMRGLEKIARRANVPIVPVALDGVYGSIFSFESGRVFWKLPKRIPYPVDVRFGEPLAFDTPAHVVRDRVQVEIAEARIERARGAGSLGEEFLRAAKRAGRRPAVADSSGAALSHRELAIGALALRSVLDGELGGEDRGELDGTRVERRVGLLLPPSVGGALANLAVTLSGRVAVNLNYTLPNADLAAEHGAIGQAGLRHVITSRRFLKALDRESPLPPERTLYLEDLRPRVTTGRKLAAALRFLFPARWVARRGARALDRTDVATIIFSSGSTGIPKGVVLSHGNILANLRSVSQALKLAPDDAILGVLPFFHSFGYTATLWAPLLRGAKVVYHPVPTDAKTIGELAHAHRVTIMIATPTFYRQYLRRCTPEQLAAVRIAAVGAERLDDALADAWREKFGGELYEGYGCTELSPVVSFNLPDSEGMGARERGHERGTVGRAISGVAVRIVDVDSGEPCAPDEEGLVLVRGPNVMQGYLDQPELTAEVMRDGWYVTGDVGCLDGRAFLRLTDRLSRFSKIGGEMVPHGRVEEALVQALTRLDGPREDVPRLAVTAVPDEKKGERLVVVHTELAVAVDLLLEELERAELPRLFTPRAGDFVRVDELPCLGTGKLDLRGLRRLAYDATVEGDS